MAIDMLIRKKWDKFSLDINFKSQSKQNRRPALQAIFSDP